MRKKIVAFTAIRSEYDLLSGLYKLLNEDPDVELKIVVSGAHLSKTYGYSVTDIESDGLEILARIETLIDSDSKASRIKSGAILLHNSVDIVANYNPDLIIYAGDREEVIIASLIGGYLEIPTMHFFGGDHVKDSHIDNPIRHATSKLSTIHMVSHKEHAQRLIRMGESEDRVYNIGSIALDKFINESTRSKNEIRKYFKINYGFDSFAVVIFHPIPKERGFSADIFENILLSLKERNIYAFVSYPNIDPGNREIIKIIDKYQNDVNFLFYRNQPRSIFISIYKNATFIIGNSSSGILESASIPIPAINVGYRQTGRLANENVVFANGEISSIVGAIDKVQSKEYEKIIINVKNIYGDGHSSEKALNIIKNNDFNSLIFKDEDILENASQ